MFKKLVISLVLLIFHLIVHGIETNHFNDSVSRDVKTDIVTDSVRLRQLQEFVVKGDNAWLERDKAVFIPSKRDKRLSNSVSTLLERMKIPLLITGPQGVTNIAGKRVTVFINGVKANEIDYATFWPKQALRVEYMEYPSDPAFEGAECVVNFIMKRNDTGGVAKFDLNQKVRNNGDYDIASKIEHGKMSYGVRVNASYNRDHLSSSSGREVYSDIIFDDTAYQSIERDYDESSFSRSDIMDIACNVKYVSGRKEIDHNAALRWTHNPGSGYRNRIEWIPDILKGEYSNSITKGRALSPQFKGNYKIPISSKVTFTGLWKYSYARNNNSYLYQYEDVGSIANQTRENVNSMTAAALISWRVSILFATSVQIRTSLDLFDTRYSGSSAEDLRQSRGETSADINLWWKISDYFVITARPGINIAYWKSGILATRSHLTPKGTAAVAWAPSSKFSINGNVYHSRNTPLASETADVILRQTELLWHMGNPYLKSSSQWNVGAYMTWLPAKWIRIVNSVGWKQDRNEIVSLYVPSPRNEGVVRTLINGKPFNHYNWDMVISFPSFINNIFSANIQPTYRYYKASGIFERSMGWFRLRGSIGADIGDFHVGVNYDGVEKYLSEGGSKILKTLDGWSINATYGTGDWYFNLRIDDLFHSRKHDTLWMSGGSLDSFSDEWTNGRVLKINISYTFGFGKKIKKNVNISGPEEIRTGVVRMLLKYK